MSSQLQHQSISSNSESDDECDEDVLSDSDDDGAPASHQPPDQHQHQQRWLEVHSDVSGTLFDFSEASTEVPLRAVAQFVLQRGSVRLQDAVEVYEAAGGWARLRAFHAVLRASPSASASISILWRAQVGLDAARAY